MNAILDNPHFKGTRFETVFREDPLGFVDIGSSGGIYPPILPFASLTHCTCFEPDKKEYKKLKQAYKAGKQFSEITLFNIAIGENATRRKLYVTKSAVNTSLLRPNEELIDRYNLEGLQLKEIETVQTESLDDILFKNKHGRKRLAEFIKMDCQGAEYEILKGAEKTLQEQCVALYIEVEFMKPYKRQKIFSEIDLFLRKKGFQLYGLYPHYISTKKIDRRKFETEERIIWADAMYFRDPIELVNREREYSQRDINVLLLVAMLTHYYDFALEMVDLYFKEAPDGDRIKNLVFSLAETRKRGIEDDMERLLADCIREPEKKYVLAKKFIDRHKTNNSIDFLVP
ncbi:MAG: FkbM family methyltransferase [Deltaproteobacteria bacterium]|nr:FkbM family methyltransferase [Deltaproteobacteria bacterium]